MGLLTWISKYHQRGSMWRTGENKEMIRMRNFKAAFLMFLTILALTICAALPVIVALLQDRSIADNSGYSEMKSMDLEGNEQRESIPTMGKLALFRNMETIDLDPSQASMTEEEVFQAAQEQMKAYEEAGIFQWFDVTLRSAEPKLGIDMKDANNFLVYWTVSFVNEDGEGQWLNLDIDDETGKILCIYYGVYGSYSMDGVWQRNKIIMQKFTDTYFSQLDLTVAKELALSAETGYAYYERDGGVSGALYNFWDADYGEISLEFYVEGPGGFYLHLPN